MYFLSRQFSCYVISNKNPINVVFFTHVINLSESCYLHERSFTIVHERCGCQRYHETHLKSNHQLLMEQNHELILHFFLTLILPNSFFRRFSGHSQRWALFVYRFIGATLITNFFDDPFLN